ncbi:MAG: FAD-dependent oxidoreductase [Ignavibacteriales bacterium]|nr:FAD-dependent oxidoreductase [Ignavibacteriales bacterium]
MRPQSTTPAHKTDLLAELVCSNSFKGIDPLTAHGILKREMAVTRLHRPGQLPARRCVPAGKALAVDRTAFACRSPNHILIRSPDRDPPGGGSQDHRPGSAPPSSPPGR